MNRHRFVPVEWIRLKFTAKPWSPDFIKVFILPESSLTLTVPAEVITCSGRGQAELPPVSGQQRRKKNDPDHTAEASHHSYRRAASPKNSEKCFVLEISRFTYEIRKQSLDARHKEDKKFVYTVDIKLDNESRVLKKVHDKNIMLISEKKYHFPSSGSETLSHRPIVIGSGPAGLFCAWYLAKAGYCPLVLERGEEADKRQETVENFWKNGILDPDSNVQFGEGGAGTFSDGKLNTLVKDTFGRGKEVLSRFVEAGAPSEILYQQKPHLGTDQLVGIVQFMRHQIEEMGGEFRFRSTVTDLIIRDRKLNAVIVNAKEEIPAEICILAPGHSARDTFAMLENTILTWSRNLLQWGYVWNIRRP